MQYAHDLPLEAWVELGVIGLALVLALYLTTIGATLRADRESAVLLGPAALAFLAADVLDWPWHLAGCSVIWAIAVGGCCRWLPARPRVLLVGERLEHVQARRAPRRERRRHDPATPDRMIRTISVPTGIVSGKSSSGRVNSTASTTPITHPSRPPMSAVMTASQRTIWRTCRRVVPTARSIPISARALGDREHERVHDPEQRDDDRQ